MKIYNMDYGWAGCDVVIAENKFDAAKIIIEQGNNRYCFTMDTIDKLIEQLVESDIVNGYVFSNYGDK